MPSPGPATAARLPVRLHLSAARGTAVDGGGRPIPPNAGGLADGGPRSTPRNPAHRNREQLDGGRNLLPDGDLSYDFAVIAPVTGRSLQVDATDA